jgi:WD40 repeat protein
MPVAPPTSPPVWQVARIASARALSIARGRIPAVVVVVALLVGLGLRAARDYMNRPDRDDSVQTFATNAAQLDVAFSPDGELVAAGGWDQTVTVWERQTGRHLSTLQGHTDRVMALSFSPDGRLLASGSKDATARIWNVQRGGLRYVIHGHKDRVMALDFSRDGKLLATGSRDASIKIWDVARSRELWTVRQPT